MKKISLKILLSCFCLSFSVTSFACDWKDLPDGLRHVIDKDNKEAFDKRDNPKKACDLKLGKDSFFRFFSKNEDHISKKEPHLFQYQKCEGKEWEHVGQFSCSTENKNNKKLLKVS